MPRWLPPGSLPHPRWMIPSARRNPPSAFFRSLPRQTPPVWTLNRRATWPAKTSRPWPRHSAKVIRPLTNPRRPPNRALLPRTSKARRLPACPPLRPQPPRQSLQQAPVPRRRPGLYRKARRQFLHRAPVLQRRSRRKSSSPKPSQPHRQPRNPPAKPAWKATGRVCKRLWQPTAAGTRRSPQRVRGPRRPSQTRPSQPARPRSPAPPRARPICRA